MGSRGQQGTGGGVPLEPAPKKGAGRWWSATNLQLVRREEKKTQILEDFMAIFSFFLPPTLTSKDQGAPLE
jgi:hypothetical protein